MSSAPPPPLPLVEGRAPGCRGPPGKVGGGTAADAVLGAGSAKLMDLWGVGRLSTGHCCHPTLSLSLFLCHLSVDQLLVPWGTLTNTLSLPPSIPQIYIKPELESIRSWYKLPFLLWELEI